MKKVDNFLSLSFIFWLAFLFFPPSFPLLHFSLFLSLTHSLSLIVFSTIFFYSFNFFPFFYFFLFSLSFSHSLFLPSFASLFHFFWITLFLFLSLLFHSFLFLSLSLLLPLYSVSFFHTHVFLSLCMLCVTLHDRESIVSLFGFRFRRVARFPFTAMYIAKDDAVYSRGPSLRSFCGYTSSKLNSPSFHIDTVRPLWYRFPWIFPR